MKSLAAGNLLSTGISVEDCIRFSLSQPIDVLVTGIDSLGCWQNLRIARALCR